MASPTRTNLRESSNPLASWDGAAAAGISGCDPDDATPTQATSLKKKSFKAQVKEVLHYLSVVQRLKNLATRKRASTAAQARIHSLGPSQSGRDVASSLNEAAFMAKSLSLSSSMDSDSLNTLAQPSTSGQTQGRNAPRGVPRWFESLCRARGGASNVCLPTAGLVQRPEDGKGGRRPRPAALACPCDGRPDALCARHAMRALWKRYFFAFPRSDAKVRSADCVCPKQATACTCAISETFDVGMLRAFLFDDTELVQVSPSSLSLSLSLSFSLSLPLSLSRVSPPYRLCYAFILPVCVRVCT